MSSSIKQHATIGLLDYGGSNLCSVRKALEACGAQVQVVDKPTDFNLLSHSSALVVPGVGSFGFCVKNLKSKKLWIPVLHWLQVGRPYLGICLGYHLLFEESEESPEVKGFGILSGKVVRFSNAALKVPHMGWNELLVKQPVLFEKIPVPASAYFTHSYYPIPKDSAIISSECEYGVLFAASVTHGQVVATQFHPEKSQSTGLQFITNFLHSL